MPLPIALDDPAVRLDALRAQRFRSPINRGHLAADVVHARPPRVDEPLNEAIGPSRHDHLELEKAARDAHHAAFVPKVLLGPARKLLHPEHARLPFDLTIEVRAGH